MAWTAPRTWVTGETVTAALMNTHVRDNLLQAAAAKVTTAGDVVYATGANALARLGIGTPAQFLVGGASAPSWSNTIGNSSNQGIIEVKGTGPYIKWTETDAADPADYWRMMEFDELMYLQWHDNSAGTNNSSLTLAGEDYILHTGTNGQGAGAVVIATDTGGSSALTTSGTIYLTATVATGGPAYVEGFWMVEIARDSAASVSGVQITVREDGNNLSTVFSYGSGNTGIADTIAAASDQHQFGGMFWRRVTASDSSAYQIFIDADDNSRFTANRGHLYVRSIQYPT
jgi:hypothetical protein